MRSISRNERRLGCFKDGNLLAEAELADRPIARLLGLCFRSSLPEGQALWLMPCYAIHSFGVRFAFDAVFLDKHHRVMGVLQTIRPWRLCRSFAGTVSVLELPAGSVSRHRLVTGDRLEFRVLGQPQKPRG